MTADDNEGDDDNDDDRDEKVNKFNQAAGEVPGVLSNGWASVLHCAESADVVPCWKRCCTSRQLLPFSLTFKSQRKYQDSGEND